MTKAEVATHPCCQEKAVDVRNVLADYAAQHGNPEDFDACIATVAELIDAAENLRPETVETPYGQGVIVHGLDRLQAAAAACRASPSIPTE